MKRPGSKGSKGSRVVEKIEPHPTRLETREGRVILKHYLKVKGGDTILVDLGEYGIEIGLDPKKMWYDVRYVTIEYDDKGDAVAEMLHAEVIVESRDREERVPAAENVRIYRHEYIDVG